MNRLCPNCKGAGAVINIRRLNGPIEPCPVCGGSKFIPKFTGNVSNMPTAKIKVVSGGTAPFKKNESDSCWDLIARKVEWTDDNTVLVHLGVKIEPPPGYDVRLYPRSSFSEYDWILSNHVGIGDEDYRGEYMAVFKMLPKSLNWDMIIKDAHFDEYEVIEFFGTSDFPYKVGDRCIQMEIRKKDPVILEIVNELSETERGTGGFGSTGK